MVVECQKCPFNILISQLECSVELRPEASGKLCGFEQMEDGDGRREYIAVMKYAILSENGMARYYEDIDTEEQSVGKKTSDDRRGVIAF